jgi:urea transporter
MGMRMDRILVGWERSCASSTILRFVDINLRGAGQVIFQNNPISGLLFLAALSWGALATNVPHVAAGGICGLVTATLTALSLRADPSKLRSGIYSYNAILTGLALTYFLGPELWVLGYAMLGGAVTAIARVCESCRILRAERCNMCSSAAMGVNSPRTATVVHRRLRGALRGSRIADRRNG